MTSDEHATGHDEPGEAPGEARGPGHRGGSRYGLLLIILLSSYLLGAFLPRERWLGALDLGLFTVVGLLALRNSPVRSTSGRVAISAGLVLSLVTIVVSASLDTSNGRAVAAIWTGFLLLVTVVVVIRQILMLPNVTIQSIYGAISAYLIIGLMYAAFYSAIYYFHGKNFFANGEPGNSSTFQYFSFTTLTTLGYGDFTTTNPGGRAIAMIEAMTGQIFLATLVARLVATFKPASRSADPDAADVD
jgi:hypothetical protein